MNVMEIFDYRFSEDSSVDETVLLNATRRSLEATNAYYATNRRRYFEETYNKVDRGADIPYAHFWQPGDSTTDVVLVINPFGTPIKPPHTAKEMTEYVMSSPDDKEVKKVNPNDANKLLQAKFFYDTMHVAGITDEAGRGMPLIVISSPSLDHRNTLSSDERKTVAGGDFGPFAVRALDIVRRYRFSRIHAAGYSLGTIAASAVELAGSKHLDVLSGNYVGDAPHFKLRRPIEPLPLGILKPYMFDKGTKKFENRWAVSNGLLPRKEGSERGEGYSLRHWFGNGNMLTNIAIAKGLSRGNFSRSLAYMNDHGIPTSISWSESKLMAGFEDYITAQPDALDLAGRGLLNLFRAKEAPHISGENPVFLTDVMVRSLLFARENQA